MSEYNRASIRVGRTGSSQDFPAASLADFVRYHVDKGTDYATAFARACEPHGDEPSFEKVFDKYWERYDER